MTEAEQKAAEAWSLMFGHAMPARIALDFVQDAAGERQKALEAILTRGVKLVIENAPVLVGPAEWKSNAQDLILLMRRCEWNAADYAREGMRVGITLDRRNLELGEPQRGVYAIDCEVWLMWLSSVKHTLSLCRELTAEATRIPEQKT
jgi:hypothetical protein